MEEYVLRCQLLGLVKDGKCCHGYAITRRLNQSRGKPLLPRRIYKCLHELKDQGLLSRTIEPPAHAGPPRYNYAITAVGEQRLQTWATELREQVEQLHRDLKDLEQRLGKKQENDDNGPGL